MSLLPSAAEPIATGSARDPWYLATTPLETRPWLMRIRWATAAVEVSLLALTFGLPQLDLPLDHIAALIVADAVMNVLMARTLSQGKTPSRSLATLALGIQVWLLTALL